MPLIQVPDVGEVLRQRYRIVHPFGLFLAEEVVPVSIVDDLSGVSPYSTGFPRRCMGQTIIAAGGAGTVAEGLLVGRGGSGIVAQVKTALIHDTVGLLAFEVRVGGGGLALAAGRTEVFGKHYLDLRVFDAVPVTELAQNTPLSAAVDGDRIGIYEVAQDTVLPVDLDIALGDGDFVNIVQASTNRALRVTYIWEEHLIEGV